MNDTMKQISKSLKGLEHEVDEYNHYKLYDCMDGENERERSTSFTQ